MALNELSAIFQIYIRMELQKKNTLCPYIWNEFRSLWTIDHWTINLHIQQECEKIQNKKRVFDCKVCSSQSKIIAKKMWVKYKHKIFSLNIYIFKVSILHQNYISIPTYQIALTSHFYRAQFRNSGNIKFLSKILETSNNGYSVFAGG